ncbi:hypothetical protein [Haloarchaeobius sp. DFWS5]|uniref:hypothetical protein n=1 Tax=Haloarchaeobius sp. DFWS5 TaxID=3446114 RepID=UPI003EBDFF84
MRRRDFLAASSTGIALLSAGCVSSMGLGAGGATTESDHGTDTFTDRPTRTTPRIPNVDFTIVRTDDGRVKVVHMEGLQVERNVTATVGVTVDGEAVPVVDDNDESHTYFAARESALAADETAATPFPISVGNRVFVDAPTEATVAVTWVGAEGRTAVLETKTVE